MFVLYIEIAVILSIVFGSLAASHLEKRREKYLRSRHPEFISGSTEIPNHPPVGRQNDTNFEQDLKKIKQESIFQFGREQFKKLISQNLSVPVTML